jgi:hypothetical protein
LPCETNQWLIVGCTLPNSKTGVLYRGKVTADKVVALCGFALKLGHTHYS